ncbi:hypothetical protein MH117_09985 [Paenibacillus sp. ACRRX]|uniref:BC1872 family protein n=1 Tax=Paenibacillus sp. ACRRX TaxID=2918206 RepID=UPI001EF3DC65|nr:hypothetical protein [Paenibacillus sp. ACRRX]MCG7407753.1 hypothetical protein [Paenibacillus sp. ACRRX]
MAMTREQVIEKWDGMTPRERDAWVAEVVFGKRVYCEPKIAGGRYYEVGYGYVTSELDDYTSDISSAESVLAQIPDEVYIYRKPTGEFVVSFGYSTGECDDCNEEGFEVEAQGKAQTLQEAICLASVIAKLSTSV